MAAIISLKMMPAELRHSPDWCQELIRFTISLKQVASAKARAREAVQGFGDSRVIGDAPAFAPCTVTEHSGKRGNIATQLADFHILKEISCTSHPPCATVFQKRFFWAMSCYQTSADV